MVAGGVLFEAVRSLEWRLAEAPSVTRVKACGDSRRWTTAEGKLTCYRELTRQYSFKALAVMREMPSKLAVGDEDVEVTFHRHRTSVAISC